MRSSFDLILKLLKILFWTNSSLELLLLISKLGSEICIYKYDPNVKKNNVTKNIILGESLKIKILAVTITPNHILRPSEEIIASNTTMDINTVNVLVKKFKSLQKINPPSVFRKNKILLSLGCVLSFLYDFMGRIGDPDFLHLET